MLWLVLALIVCAALVITVGVVWSMGPEPRPSYPRQRKGPSQRLSERNGA